MSLRHVIQIDDTSVFVTVFFVIFLPMCLQSWLRMYGYLPQANRRMSTMRSAQILSNAISDMQRFYGLEVTGQMDPQTIRSAGLNDDTIHLDLYTQK